MTSEPVESATATSNSLVELDLNGPVSKPLDKKLLDAMKELEAKKRQPHEAAFRGWKEVAGYEEEDALTPDDEIMDLLTKSTLLDNYLPEIAYGDWYHQVAIVILGGFLSWFLGRFRFSIGPVFFVTFITTMYYRSSIRKYRLSLRLAAQREFSVNHIEDDFESMDWLNVFLDKYWIFLEPSIAQIACEQVNPILATLPIPAFVKQLWIHTLTLGTKPPRIDKVRTLDRTDDDVTVMDWWVSYTPNSLADSTVKQMKNRANQHVIVKAKLFGLTLPVVVSDVAFKGKFRVRLRMMSNFPHIQTVNVSLMEAPHFDFVAKPFGGDSIFAWEFLNLPGIYMFINEMVRKFAGPIVFDPLSFQLNLEQLLAGNGVSGALGILELNVKSAKNLKAADTFNNTIDPYLTFGFGSQVLTKTKVIPDTMNPVWNERVNVMLKSSSEPLSIILYDENESDGRKDKFMGAALYDLEEVMIKGEMRNITLPILRNNKPAGEVTFDLKLMKTLQGSQLPDGSYNPPPDLNTGVANLQLLGARSYSRDEKKPDSVFAELYVNQEKVVTSGVVKGQKEASWSLTHEDIVTDRSKTKVRVILRDNSKQKKITGSTTLQLTDIIDATYVGNSWFPVAKGLGEVKLSCQWNSVAMTGSSGSIGYTQPVGVLRINIQDAENLINLEKFGVIDPYVRIMVNGIQRGRTLTMESTTEPKFNQSIYVPVSSANQRVTIEAMDVQRNTPDRTLGSFQIRLNEFVDFNQKGEVIETMGEVTQGRLVHKKKGAKGTINYQLAFFPALPVLSVDDIAEMKERQAKKAQLELEKQSGEKKSDAKIEPLEDDEADEDSKPKIDLPLSEVPNYETGVCVFSIIDGNFSSDGYLQVFFDKNGYPSFESQRLSSRQNKVNSTGDYLVKELKYSTVTFKFTHKKGSNVTKPGISEITIPTLQLIENTYDKQQMMKISNGLQIKIQTRWVPILMEQLPMMDSIGNSGTLRLRLVKATNLPAADSNGKSDPFTKVYLNGKEVFKTKTIKKNLNPEWNEETSIDIDNRVCSTLRFKVNDWDLGLEQDDKLGELTLQLAEVNPFAEDFEDMVLSLKDDDGQPAGELYVQVFFKAEYHTLLSADKALPNFAGAGLDGAGKLLGSGVDGAGKIIGGAGKVGGKVLGTAAGLFKKKDKKET
ncbi:hypothetical protein CANARDRAFT_9769 [[Candida] arabinofermentans NRRL YB-2248]|uniref:C2 domain-containing protein n=1 Tax=[Candida] arabinofermentans NRRL YB-2248 TaxID=983967 RepID=A0A1E4SUK7_9ASCO|nr:hypothetical protein CANARDRAFT_9769 [[Candida] arabinofermentans NRRL YB-2248]